MFWTMILKYFIYFGILLEISASVDNEGPCTVTWKLLDDCNVCNTINQTLFTSIEESEEVMCAKIFWCSQTVRYQDKCFAYEICHPKNTVPTITTTDYIPDLTTIESPSEELSISEQCGWANAVDNNISGGHTVIDEFPWIVSVTDTKPFFMYKKLEKHPIGVGAIIHPVAILTVASILEGREKVWVIAGEADARNAQIREVSTIQKHQRFNPESMANDIALLFLEEPVDRSTNVGLICLPPPQHYSPIFGYECVAIDQNMAHLNEEENLKLSKVAVSRMGHSTCQTKLMELVQGLSFKVQETLVCAVEQSMDTVTSMCSRTVFSHTRLALVCPLEVRGKRYVLNGLAFSMPYLSCSNTNHTRMYTNIAKYRKWIDGEVKTMNLSPSVYTY